MPALALEPGAAYAWRLGTSLHRRARGRVRLRLRAPLGLGRSARQGRRRRMVRGAPRREPARRRRAGGGRRRARRVVHRGVRPRRPGNAGPLRPTPGARPRRAVPLGPESDVPGRPLGARGVRPVESLDPDDARWTGLWLNEQVLTPWDSDLEPSIWTETLSSRI